MIPEAGWYELLRDAIPAEQVAMVLRILIAGFLGALIGWEREVQGKAAGLRTHILVAVASGLFASVTMLVAESQGDAADALRTVNAVATGVGFLGAGLIFVNRSHQQVFGLTTAASVWATSAVGLTVGFGFFFLASCTTMLVWIVLRLLNWLTPEILHSADDKDHAKKPNKPKL